MIYDENAFKTDREKILAKKKAKWDMKNAED